LELLVRAQLLEILVGHQTVTVDVTEINRLVQILQRLIGVLRSLCHTSEGVPN